MTYLEYTIAITIHIYPLSECPMGIVCSGPISPTTLEQKTKNYPIKKKKKKFTRGGEYTWVGKGYFFATGKKFNDFKSCLPGRTGRQN
jgi:hypothetical protein